MHCEWDYEKEFLQPIATIGAFAFIRTDEISKARELIANSAALLARAEDAEKENIRIDDIADEVCMLMNANDWSGAFKKTKEAFRLFNRFVCIKCGAQHKSMTESFRCEACGGTLETKVVRIPLQQRAALNGGDSK